MDTAELTKLTWMVLSGPWNELSWRTPSHTQSTGGLRNAAQQPT